tara:strand:- start:49425 stop:49550 length:126 start_codon:yes stop_codon:yes gene_type:complete
MENVGLLKIPISEYKKIIHFIEITFPKASIITYNIDVSHSG